MDCLFAETDFYIVKISKINEADALDTGVKGFGYHCSDGITRICIGQGFVFGSTGWKYGSVLVEWDIINPGYDRNVEALKKSISKYSYKLPKLLTRYDSLIGAFLSVDIISKISEEDLPYMVICDDYEINHHPTPVQRVLSVEYGICDKNVIDRISILIPNIVLKDEEKVKNWCVEHLVDVLIKHFVGNCRMSAIYQIYKEYIDTLSNYEINRVRVNNILSKLNKMKTVAGDLGDLNVEDVDIIEDALIRYKEELFVCS